MAPAEGALVDLPVVGNEHAAFADGERLAAHQRHGGHVAEVAHLAAAVEAAVGVRHILDHLEPVAAGELHDRRHLRRVSAVVDHHQRPGASGDAVLQVRRIEAQGGGVDLREHRGGTEPECGQGGGPVGDAGTDHFIADTYAAGPHRRLNGVGSGVVGQRMAAPLPDGELLLELDGLIEARHRATPQHVQHGVLDFLVDERPGEQVVLLVRDRPGTAVEGGPGGRCGGGGRAHCGGLVHTGE